MNNTIQYKGYVGSVEFSEEDGIFYGKVMGIRSLISYEGESAKELLDDFHGAIDDYLETCKAEGKQPEIAFKGSFNIRLSPDLHKKLFIYTTAHQISMNKHNRLVVGIKNPTQPCDWVGCLVKRQLALLENPSLTDRKKSYPDIPFIN